MKKILLLTALLAISIPAIAQDAPKEDAPKKYNAVATAAWDEEGGKHRSVVSYAESPDKDRAEDLAMKGCFAKGGKECEAHGPWSKGCIYAAVLTAKSGNGYWMMREKEEDLFQAAREKNRTMSKPIGGCVGS
jgi:hypothetical protein